MKYDLLLERFGAVSCMESFVYLGSLIHFDLSGHHDVEAFLKKAPHAFGTLLSKIFSSCKTTCATGEGAR